MKAGKSICLRLLAGAMLWLMACTFPAWADPPGRVGRISFMTGPVSFNVDPDGDDWTAAIGNYPLTTGNRLWTDTGARAEVRIGAISVRLDQRTALGFTRLDDEAIELFVGQGSVVVSLRETVQNEPIFVMSPDTSVTLNGHARYRIQVSPAGDRTDITVRRGGEAEIAAGASVFSAYEDQTATVYGVDRVYYDIATALPPDDFEHWARERDRRTAPPQAAQFVSPETTGYEDLDSYGSWRSTPDYGAVWIPSNVAPDWAPYRFGHWAWVAPWGWTWVDDAPWGFAPFHYGRWAYVGTTWAWVPGRIAARPVYAPALVAFVDSPQLSASLGLRDHCGWVPLAPSEAFIPWYQVSSVYVRNVNLTHGTTVVSVGSGFAYINRTVPGAVTIVPNQSFARGEAVNGRFPRNIRIGDNVANRWTTGSPPVVQLEPARRMFPMDQHRPPPETAARLNYAVSPTFRARPVEGGVPEHHGRPGGDDRDAGRPTQPRPGAAETHGAPGRDDRTSDESRPPRRLGPPMVAPGRPVFGAGARGNDERDDERRGGGANGEPQYRPPGRAGNDGRGDQRGEDRRAPPPQAVPQMPPPGRPAGGNDGRGDERRAPPPQGVPQMPPPGRPAGGNDGRGDERRAPPPQAAPQMPPPARPAGSNDGRGEERRMMPQPVLRAAPVAAPPAHSDTQPAPPAPAQERRAEPPPERGRPPAEPPRNGPGERRERAPGDPRNAPPGAEKATGRPTN